MTNKALLLLMILGLASTSNASFGMPQPLPRLNIDRDSITISGISSGGFMAVQLGIAYSSEFAGVGVVAGGVYDCSGGDANVAKEICMKDPAKIDIAKSLQKISTAYARGQIDSPENIKGQNIFLLQGTEDVVMGPAAGPKLKELYQALGANITTNFTLKMGHAFPATQGPSLCRMSRSPWVNDCEYSGAGEIFKSLYGPMKAPMPIPDGVLISVDQSVFKASEAQMLDFGHLYVPKICQHGEAKCRLHVALHGCLQSPSKVGRAFIEGAGYNNWAETNYIVIFYPAVSSSMKNPGGCWDWFGYTGKNYALRTGAQAQVIMTMIDHLTNH